MVCFLPDSLSHTLLARPALVRKCISDTLARSRPWRARQQCPSEALMRLLLLSWSGRHPQAGTAGTEVPFS